MKTLKVGIASYDAMKARTLAIAKGELKPKASDPQSLVHVARELCQATVQPKSVLAVGDNRDAARIAERVGGSDRTNTRQSVANAAHNGALWLGPPAQGSARDG